MEKLVIITPLYAAPNPRKIQAIGQTAKIVMDKLLKEYKAKGGTFPLKPYDIYGWYRRDRIWPAQEVVNSDENEPDMSDMEILKSVTARAFAENKERSQIQTITESQNNSIISSASIANHCDFLDTQSQLMLSDNDDMSNIVSATPFVKNIFHGKSPIKKVHRIRGNVSTNFNSNANKITINGSRGKENFPDLNHIDDISNNLNFRTYQKNHMECKKTSYNSSKHRNPKVVDSSKFVVDEDVDGIILNRGSETDNDLSDVESLSSMQNNYHLSNLISASIIEETPFIRDNFYEKLQIETGDGICHKPLKNLNYVDTWRESADSKRIEMSPVLNYYTPINNLNQEGTLSQVQFTNVPDTINKPEDTHIEFISNEEIDELISNQDTDIFSKNMGLEAKLTKSFSKNMNQNLRTHEDESTKSIKIIQNVQLKNCINKIKYNIDQNDWADKNISMSTIKTDSMNIGFSGHRNTKNCTTKNSHLDDYASVDEMEYYRNVEQHAKVEENKKSEMVNFDNSFEVFKKNCEENKKRYNDQINFDKYNENHFECMSSDKNYKGNCQNKSNSDCLTTTIPSSNFDLVSATGPQTIEECGFLLKNMTPVCSQEVLSLNDTYMLQKSKIQPRHNLYENQNFRKPENSKKYEESVSKSTNVESNQFQLKNHDYVNHKATISVNGNEKTRKHKPKINSNNLSNYGNDWAVSNTFFEYMFGCKPTGIIENRTSFKTGDTSDMVVLQNNEDNHGDDSLNNAIVNDNIGNKDAHNFGDIENFKESEAKSNDLISREPKLYSNNLSNCGDEWAVSDNFFEYVLGCKSSDVIENRKSYKTGNSNDAEVLQKNEDNLGDVGLNNLIVKDNIGNNNFGDIENFNDSEATTNDLIIEHKCAVKDKSIDIYKNKSNFNTAYDHNTLYHPNGNENNKTEVSDVIKKYNINDTNNSIAPGSKCGNSKNNIEYKDTLNLLLNKNKNPILYSNNSTGNIELKENYIQRQQISNQIESDRTKTSQTCGTRSRSVGVRTLSETFERKLSFEETSINEECSHRDGETCGNYLSERFKKNVSFHVDKELSARYNNINDNCADNLVKSIKNYKMEISREPVIPVKYIQSKLTDTFPISKIKRTNKPNESVAKKKINMKIDDFFKPNPIRVSKKSKVAESTINLSAIANPEIQSDIVNTDPVGEKNEITKPLEKNNTDTKNGKPFIISSMWNGSSASNPIAERKRKPLADTFALKRKKTKFCTPYKSEFEELDASYEVLLLNEQNRDTLVKLIQTSFPVEINFNMVFKEGVCQLSRPSTTKSLCSPVGVMIGILWKPDSFSWYYLDTSTSNELLNTEEYRNLIYTLLNTNSHIRRNGFEVKTLYRHLMRIFSIPDGKVSMKWDLWDPLIGCWILNPDKPPASFGGALAILDLRNNYKVTSSESITNACYMITVLSEACEKMRLTLMENGLLDLFEDLETKIISVLAVMEMHGVGADANKLSMMGDLLDAKLQEYECRAHQAAAKSFKINSTVQVRRILYDELKLDTMTNARIKETAVLKSKSTSESTLLLLRNLHPLPNLILDYRHIYRAKSSYVDTIRRALKNDSINTTWDQISAATGRLSSKNPNLQAIPRQRFALTSFSTGSADSQEETLQLRSAFVARNNCTLLAIDFKHIEFRVFAHLAQDANLLAAFQTSGDIFINLSNMWLGDNISNSETDQRNRTKRIVYAVMYGAGTNKLSEILNIDQSETRKIVSSLTTKFRGLREFGAAVIKKCQKVGFLTSLSGRRRYFPNINSSNYGLRAQSERQAVNFVIQGSAADICKSAMIYTERLLRENSAMKCSLLLQIHDELVWEIADECLAVTKDVIVHAMCNTSEFCKKFGLLSVPLPVCVTTGKNWGEMN